MPPRPLSIFGLTIASVSVGCAPRDAHPEAVDPVPTVIGDSQSRTGGEHATGPAPTTKPATLTVADLRERPVIGRLGVPLGTVVEIEATVVSGDQLRQRALAGRYLLKVTRVDARPSAEAPLVEFSVPAFASVGLAAGHFELYELKTGRRAGTLDSSQIPELERGYVGKTVRVMAYETGGFSGVPAKLPPEATWADVGFGFRTSVIVVSEKQSSSDVTKPSPFER